MAKMVVEIKGRDAEKVLKELTRAAEGFGASVKVMSDKVDKTDSSLKRFASSARKLDAALMKVAIGGLVAAGTGLLFLAKSSFQVSREFEAVQRIVTPDQFRFLLDESQRLGLGLQESAEAFKNIAAAAQGTSLEGEKTRDIFTSVAEASTALGLSANKTKKVMFALEQILSKGVVSTEELRRQMGEHLPGAFRIAAQSMGKSTLEFSRLLNLGKVMSDDFLPAFATELRAAFADKLPAALLGTEVSINRFENALLLARKAMGDEFKPEFNDFRNSLTEFLASGTTKELAVDVGNLAKSIIALANSFVVSGQASTFLSQFVQDMRVMIASLTPLAQQTLPSLEISLAQVEKRLAAMRKTIADRGPGFQLSLNPIDVLRRINGERAINNLLQERTDIMVRIGTETLTAKAAALEEAEALRLSFNAQKDITGAVEKRVLTEKELKAAAKAAALAQKEMLATFAHEDKLASEAVDELSADVEGITNKVDVLRNAWLTLAIARAKALEPIDVASTVPDRVPFIAASSGKLFGEGFGRAAASEAAGLLQSGLTDPEDFTWAEVGESIGFLIGNAVGGPIGGVLGSFLGGSVLGGLAGEGKTDTSAEVARGTETAIRELNDLLRQTLAPSVLNVIDTFEDFEGSLRGTAENVAIATLAIDQLKDSLLGISTALTGRLQAAIEFNKRALEINQGGGGQASKFHEAFEGADLELINLADLASQLAAEFAGVSFEFMSVQAEANSLREVIGTLGLGAAQTAALLNQVTQAEQMRMAVLESDVLQRLVNVLRQIPGQQENVARMQAQIDQARFQIEVKMIEIQLNALGLMTQAFQNMLNVASAFGEQLSNFNVSLGHAPRINVGGLRGGGGSSRRSRRRQELDSLRETLERLASAPGLQSLNDRLRELTKNFFGPGGFAEEARRLGLDMALVTRAFANQRRLLMEEANRSIRSFLAGLKQSELNPGGPGAQFGAAKSSFFDLVRRAQGGDLDARSQLGQSAQELLQQGQQRFGNTNRYRQLFASVTGSLESLLGKGGAGTIDEQKISLAQEQVSLLRIIAGVEGGPIPFDRGEREMVREISALRSDQAFRAAERAKAKLAADDAARTEWTKIRASIDKNFQPSPYVRTGTGKI